MQQYKQYITSAMQQQQHSGRFRRVNWAAALTGEAEAKTQEAAKMLVS